MTVSRSGVLGSFQCVLGRDTSAIRHVAYGEPQVRDNVEFTIQYDLLLDTSVDVLRIELVAFSPVGVVGPQGQRIRVDGTNVPAGGWGGSVSFTIPYRGDGFYGCQIYLGDTLVGRRSIEVRRIG